jgi:hypothetical protein
MVHIIRLNCSWCSVMNEVTEGETIYCPSCGHRADKMREECDCRTCVETRRLLTIRECEREWKKD